MKYFFDSYAVIELIKSSQNYLIFKDEVVATSALNLAEVHYFLMGYAGEALADTSLNGLNLEIIEFDKKIAINASKFRFKNKKLKFSYADSLGYCAAIENNLIFLTGDDAFDGMNSVEFVK